VLSWGPTGATLKEVAKTTALHTATAHRILTALLGEGFLDYDARRRTYTAGAALLTSATLVRDMFGLTHAARPSMDRLVGLRPNGVFLGIRCGNDALCVDVRLGPESTLPARLHVNDRWPLGVGSFSMAILAFLPLGEVSQILAANKTQLTRYPELAPHKLRRLVQQTRGRGYALARAKTPPRTMGLAVPIFDPKRHPVASLCLVLPADRSGPEQREALVDALTAEARTVAERWWNADTEMPAPNW
jgi:DNA-binding IclR family transcriptional regulator